MIVFIKKNLFPIVWSIITLILYFIILLTSERISIWPPLISAKGLSLFVEVFSIPLYFFAAGIPIYGIILTIKRIDLSNKQYTLLMYSSYYNHLDEFIKSLDSTNSNDIRIISNESKDSQEYLFRKWHTIWFGSESTFDHLVIESTVVKAENFLRTVSDVRRRVLNDETIDQESLSNIKNQLYDLGINVKDDIVHSVQHKGTVGQFQSSVKIVVNILKYSGKEIPMDEYIQLLIE
jgi:hypothetical protein